VAPQKEFWNLAARAGAADPHAEADGRGMPLWWSVMLG